MNTTTEKVKYSDDGITVIRSNNISNNQIDFQNVKYVDEQTFNRLNDSCKPKYGDVLFCNIGSDLGSAAEYIYQYQILINWNVFRIQIDRNKIVGNLLTQYLNKIKPSVRKYATESTMPFISSKAFKFIKIDIPSLPEQQKIADFLTAVDKRIELLEKKKTLLETYKKGVMKKIFNQKIRFKDESGSDFPDWEEKKLGEIGDIVTGKTPSTSNKSYWNGQIQFITPTDIHSGIKYQRDTTRTVTEFKGIKILPVGSIVYTCIASIGKMAITKNPSITNQQINSIITKDINTEFLYYSLQYLTPRIQSLKSTTTLPIINKTEFTGFKIHCPAIIEQQKISQFLSSIDTQLELLETKIDKSKTWKKGLLQKMFV